MLKAIRSNIIDLASESGSLLCSCWANELGLKLISVNFAELRLELIMFSFHPVPVVGFFSSSREAGLLLLKELMMRLRTEEGLKLVERAQFMMGESAFPKAMMAKEPTK